MAELSLPPCDEPVDFRRQAAVYGQYRPDYSAALYDAIASRAGAAGARRVVDLGCGTGFVARALAARGWDVVGVDFSAPMLAAARATSPTLWLLRATAEALPLRAGSAGLVACGTAFHWFAPMPALVEMERVLSPGGWVALFWRYPLPGQSQRQLLREALRHAGVDVPEDFQDLHVHPAEPFAGSRLRAEPVLRIESMLEFTAATFHGFVGTFEWLRRLTGPRHADFLDALGEELGRRYPHGLSERSCEYVFLGRKPPQD